jgi:hypothetical protein
VLVASLGFGSSVAKTQPTLTPPAPWTMAGKTNKDPLAAIAVYWHVFAAGETFRPFDPLAHRKRDG